MRVGGREVEASSAGGDSLPQCGARRWIAPRTPTTHHSTPILAANAKGGGRYITSMHAWLRSHRYIYDAVGGVRILAAASLRKSNV